MPKLTVSPAVDGTWVRLECPDGTVSDFNNPLELWHAIVSQPGFYTPEQLGLLPTTPLEPANVRPERVRIQAVATRCARNAASLRKYGIAVSGLPDTPSKPTKPSKLRVPKWAREAAPAPDAETACL